VRGRTILAVAAAVALGTALRLAPWPFVFRGDGVRFLMDGDPYYHVLRAQELARSGSVPWHDGALNFPIGADVPWPPLYDAVLAVAGWVAGGGEATEDSVESAAAFVPVLLGAAGIVAVALLASATLGAPAAAPSAAFAAAIGWHVDVGLLGRPDQHVAEILLLASILAVFARAVRTGEERALRRAGGALGVLLALAFWTWLGSALHVGVLAAAVGAWHVAAPGGDGTATSSSRLLARGAGIAAVLLAASAAWLGPPGALASGRITGISALPAAICAGTAVFAAVLARLSAGDAGRGRARRAMEVVAAAVVPAAVAFLVPGVREGVGQGFTALGTANPWYATILEFQPILGSGMRPWTEELRRALDRSGFVPVVAFGGLALLRGHAREEPSRRFGAFQLAACFALFVPLAAARIRFGPYLGVFAAVLAGHAARTVSLHLRSERTRAALVVAIVLGAVAPSLPRAVEARYYPTNMDEVLRLSRTAGALAGADEGKAILASWSVGHHVRYGSGLPVIATPFGTEGGAGAMEDTSAFHLASAWDEAERILERRRVRFILLQDPIPDAALAAETFGLPPDRAPAVFVRDVHEGLAIAVNPTLEQLVPVRLFFGDGLAIPRRAQAAIAEVRLVDEAGGPGAPRAKLFERVPGARLRVTGAPAGGVVSARTTVKTPLGRQLVWGGSARADAGGNAELRVPYATGSNGAVRASAYLVEAGKKRAATVPETAVVAGAVVQVPPGPR
jgi:dolichyl-diphosphooligosaccharide--protein glycosyltransferase